MNYLINNSHSQFPDLSNGTMSNGAAMFSSTTPCQIKAPLVVTFVGQPFRGKSLAARKISRNLFWKGENVKGENSTPFVSIIFKSSFLILVFQVEENANDETLKSITEWFETDHNVAVNIIKIDLVNATLTKVSLCSRSSTECI
jgi:hypothetical protein